MSNTQEKIWIGNGKKHQQYDLINGSICLSDIPAEHINEYNGKKYIRFTIAGKKGGADQYGKTHGISLDTWKPETNTTSQQPKQEDLPF